MTPERIAELRNLSCGAAPCVLQECLTEIERLQAELATYRDMWRIVHERMNIQPDGLCAILAWIDTREDAERRGK